MSTFHGPQQKGAMRAHRQRRRDEAALRQGRADARLIVALYAADDDTPDNPEATPERTTS